MDAAVHLALMVPIANLLANTASLVNADRIIMV